MIHDRKWVEEIRRRATAKPESLAKLDGKIPGQNRLAISLGAALVERYRAFVYWRFVEERPHERAGVDVVGLDRGIPQYGRKAGRQGGVTIQRICGTDSIGFARSKYEY